MLGQIEDSRGQLSGCQSVMKNWMQKENCNVNIWIIIEFSVFLLNEYIEKTQLQAVRVKSGWNKEKLLDEN